MPAKKLERYLTRQFEQIVANRSVEREQKYRVANLDTIRRKLRKLGARIHVSGFERNELFDQNGRLRRHGLKLRLRCHGGKIAMLTIKGPRRNGHTKTRMEVETPVEYGSAKRILELLDFRVAETYSKMREEYRLDSCTVCLDQIADSGCYVEIEGAAKKISATARHLGLTAREREHRSYRQLIKDAALSSSRNGAARR